VVVKDESEDKQAQRAIIIGGLIETFCDDQNAEKQKAKARLDSRDEVAQYWPLAYALAKTKLMGEG
jgi:hypothetical protein